MRVLKPEGTLIFKWSEHDLPSSKVWKAIGQEPLFGHRSGKQSRTFFEKAAQMLEKLPAADVAPVVHGRWIFTKRHLWYKDENGNIDEWRVDNGFHNGPECQICHTAFCEHCTPDWSTTECEIGHYYCSECAETSRDAHENYCPNCGAKMDGRE